MRTWSETSSCHFHIVLVLAGIALVFLLIAGTVLLGFRMRMLLIRTDGLAVAYPDHGLLSLMLCQ